MDSSKHAPRNKIKTSSRSFLTLLFYFALTLPFLAGFYPFVRFVDETIDIHVYRDRVVVEGYYVYENPFPFPVAQGFTIPLPIDENHPAPFNITAESLLPEKKNLPVTFAMGQHRFNAVLPAGVKSVIRAVYTQPSPEMNARYILLSTRSWGRPLQHGLYRLFPNDVRISSSNYALETSGKVMTFQRRDFMPPKDWFFSWEGL